LEHAIRLKFGRAWKYRFYYALIIPGLLFFFIFSYVPMAGLLIAFKNVNPYMGLQGIIDSPWVGLTHIQRFINSYYFWNIIRNTVLISFYKLLFGFPLPIVLALLLNELRAKTFKKIVQSISYFPHFLSAVVMTGMIYAIFSAETGLFNVLLRQFGADPVFFLGDVRYFRSVLVASDIWQGVGWASIIYLAAISGVDPHLYEAATVDGAGKFKQAWHITLPGIMHIITLLLILQIGKVLDAGFEQIVLLYSPQVYQVADIIDTYVYREGIINLNYSYTAAIGFFKSFFSLILILGANYAAKRLGQSGIW